MEDNKINNLQPEIKNIIEMIKRFVAANRGNVCFVGSFWAYDIKKLENQEEDITKEGCDINFAFGPKETLKIMLTHLDQLIEDEVDEDGFVNF